MNSTEHAPALSRELYEVRRMLFSNLGSTMLANAAIMACGFVTGVISARLLGPAGEGIVTACTLWPMALIYMGQLGVGDAVVYFSGRRREDLSRMATAATALAFGQLLVVALVGVFVLPLAMRRHGPEAVRLCLLYFAMFLPINLASYGMDILRGRLSITEWNILRLLSSFIFLMFLTALWFKNAGLTPRMVLLSMLAGPAFINVTAVALTVKAGARWRFDARVFHDVMRYGLDTAGSNVLRFAKENLDQALISLMLAASGLGLYAVATASSSVIVPLMESFESLIFPKVVAKSDPVQARAHLMENLRHAFWAGLAVLCALELFLPWAIRLVYGRAFDAARLPARILLMAFFLRGLARILTAGLRGLGLPRLSVPADAAVLAVSAVVMPLMILRWGLLGAAWAAALGSAFAVGSLGFLARREWTSAR